jgi:tetratricopeptide (TPR) repeat protein
MRKLLTLNPSPKERDFNSHLSQPSPKERANSRIQSSPLPVRLAGLKYSSTRFLVLVLLMIIGSYAHSQSEVIINTTTLLIAEGKYNDAEKYLDSLIKTDPRSIDALMMKGNVLLNYALIQMPPVRIITPQDESIFSKDVAGLKNNVVIIPKATALKVEGLWKQCLAIDSSRQDIQKGLCSLYGMALMKNELLNYLPVIVRSAKGKGNEFAYTLVEYPRLLLERGDREGAFAAYKKIAALYPSVRGINCIIAGAYFSEDDLAHTWEYAEKGVSASLLDYSPCSDALDIYSATADPDKVLSLLKTVGKDPSYRDYPFYLGISKFAHRDATWKNEMAEYMMQLPVATDSNVLYRAASFMMSPEFTDDYNGLMMLLNYNLNDFSTKLIASRAIHDYVDSIDPYVITIQVLINDKHYAKANELLSIITQNYPGRQDLLYYYAYSLYRAGEYKIALAKWNQFAEAVKKIKSVPLNLDTYLAAPNYFTGQCYLKSGNKSKALEYFKMIVASKDESKYAYLAKVQLELHGEQVTTDKEK